MSLSDVREQFPQLKRAVRGQPLVYLDSGATTLKPLSVIEAVRAHLANEAANVHRGAHFLSDEATGRFEDVREKARAFVGASSKSEIIFTRGTTESLNLLSRTLGKDVLHEGDEILLSQMEHHSNIVPWQMIAAETMAKVRFIPVLEDGSLDVAAAKKMMSSRTKIVSLVHLSNALGTVNPLKEIFAAAHAVGAYTIVDAAQSAAFLKLDVRDLGADFLAMSAHKVFGPTGVGLLYGRLELLEKLPPYQGGGSMIAEVREDGVEFLPPPHRFEAGTPPIAEVMGFGAALDFASSLGYENILAHERAIMAQAEEGLSKIFVSSESGVLGKDVSPIGSGRYPRGGLRRIGQAKDRGHVLSFLLDGVHPSDVGAILDEQGIAVRAGHHCCQPLMRRFGIPGTVRASFSVYTSEEDIARFVRGVLKAKEMLS